MSWGDADAGLILRPCSGSPVPGWASPPTVRMEHVHTCVRVGPGLLGAVDLQVRHPSFTLMSFLPRSLCTTAALALTHHESAHSTGQVRGASHAVKPPALAPSGLPGPSKPGGM